MELICSHCGTAIDSDEEEPRCPCCLRKSGVMTAEQAEVASHQRTLHELWPSGTLCPLCGERDVGDHHFYLRLSKAATHLGGNTHRWLSARGRCCAECRLQVERVETMRKLAGGALIVGILAPFGLLALVAQRDPDAKLSGTAFALGVAWMILAIVVPLFLFRRFHNRVRGLLDQLWIVEMLRDQVETPDGIPIYDLVNIHAKLPDADSAVDLGSL